MKAIEFTTKAKNGVIEIQKNILQRLMMNLELLF